MINSSRRQNKRRGHSARKSSPFPYKEKNTSKKRNAANKKNNRHDCQHEQQHKNHFELARVSPLTPNQKVAFDVYERGGSMMLQGYAGTGKTYISCYLALKEVLSGESVYDKVVIIRSTVSCRDPGFLPGGPKEKNKAYEDPYVDICNELFDKSDGYNTLKNRGIVNFVSTAYLRSTTFKNAIIIVDECQNMRFEELDVVMTRVGENSKIMFCGDYMQSDLLKDNDKAGLNRFIKIIKRMGGFDYVEFEQCDIVRSGLVKRYIIARTELGI